MSRVTIKELYRDLGNAEKWCASKDIEVVPRKMVEMIINYCKSDEYLTSKSDAAKAEAYLIRYYAECLLKQFEEYKDEVI